MSTRNPGSFAIISNHKPQSDSSFLSETTLATKKVSEPEDATIAWVRHVCQKFVDTFMARNRNSIQMTGLKIPDTNMPCEALLKLVMAVLDDRSPEDVAMLVEHMLKKVIEDFGQQNAGQEFEGPLLKTVGRQNANVQPGMHDYKSVAQEYSTKLEAQNSELKELKYALEATKLQFQNLQFGWEKEMEVLSTEYLPKTFFFQVIGYWI